MNKNILWRQSTLRLLLSVSLTLALAFSLGLSSAQAALTSGQDIIPAPASVIDDAPGAENDHQQAFDEAQDVILAGPLRCDDGVVLPAGTRVNSHMIFLNTPVNTPGAVFDNGVVWEFDGDVICVMSDSGGVLEGASNNILGAASTTYPGPFAARGMEGNDTYTVLNNKITVDMGVTEPGDWIRVVTEWVDTIPPAVACVETENPHGKQKPQAPGTGQNEDGFYKLFGRDAEGPVRLFVVDSETGTEFGPFPSGTTMKYTEANGAEPSMSAMGSNNGGGSGKATDVDYKIKGQGDAVLYAVDIAGNVSERAFCLVPNPPK
jgi:hypothetical protein